MSIRPAQLCCDVWLHRDRQTSTVGCSEPCHRSGSRRLSGRRPRISKQATSPQCSHCFGGLRTRDAIRIFSRTASAWVDGEVTELIDGGFVHVEYEVGEFWCGKTLHLHSEHIEIPAGTVLPSDAKFTAGQCSKHDKSIAKHDAKPLMQGCRTSLPISAQEYFMTPAYIFTMLRLGYVALLRGRWLLQHQQNYRVLPRRQELPPEAFWDVDELQSEYESGSAKFASISHCWYTRQHPDPDGIQLQKVGPHLSSRISDQVEKLLFSGLFRGDFDCAIFWCWCSFFQEPRANYEEDAFARSMEHVDLWYINACIEVWVFSTVPVTAANNMPYAERGWTTWEKTIAQLLPAKNKLFEVDSVLCHSDAASHYLDLASPPLEPHAFETLINSKHFTKGRTDTRLVVDNYRKNFRSVMTVVDRFEFSVNLNNLQMMSLCRVLPLCSQLRSLALAEFEVDVDTFVGVLSACPKLELLKLHRQPVMDGLNPREAQETTMEKAKRWKESTTIEETTMEKAIRKECERLDIELRRKVTAFVSTPTGPELDAVFEISSKNPAVKHMLISDYTR